MRDRVHVRDMAYNAAPLVWNATFSFVFFVRELRRWCHIGIVHAVLCMRVAKTRSFKRKLCAVFVSGSWLWKMLNVRGRYFFYQRIRFTFCIMEAGWLQVGRDSKREVNNLVWKLTDTFILVLLRSTSTTFWTNFITFRPCSVKMGDQVASSE